MKQFHRLFYWSIILSFPILIFIIPLITFFFYFLSFYIYLLYAQQEWWLHTFDAFAQRFGVLLPWSPLRAMTLGSYVIRSGVESLLLPFQFPSSVIYREFRYILSRGRSLGDGVAVARDLSYGSIQDEKVDIYYPHIAAIHMVPLPIVIFIHGGAWMHGDKQTYRHLGAILQLQGYVVVIPNYTKYPRGTIQDMIKEIKQVTEWTRLVAKSFHGDPNAITLMGHSAGAHLALQASIEYFLETRKNLAQGLFLLNGVYDIEKHFMYEKQRLVEQVSAMARVMRQKENWRLVSPVYRVSECDTLPRIVLVHGEQDKTVPCSASEELHSALKQSHHTSDLLLCEDTDHVTPLLAMHGLASHTAWFDALHEHFYYLTRNTSNPKQLA